MIQKDFLTNTSTLEMTELQNRTPPHNKHYTLIITKSDSLFHLSAVYGKFGSMSKTIQKGTFTTMSAARNRRIHINNQKTSKGYLCTDYYVNSNYSGTGDFLYWNQEKKETRKQSRFSRIALKINNGNS